MLKGFTKAKEEILKGYDKVMAGINEKIDSNKTVLDKMKVAVDRANEKFQAIGDTGYTGLTEKIETINRGYIARVYAVDKPIADNLSRMRNNLEKMIEKAQKETIQQPQINTKKVEMGRER